jgi:ribonucleoside-triphosphate reductase (thioredoxin)
MEMSVYQNVIHKTRYARWDNLVNAREDWNGTVDRYMQFFTQYLAEKHGYTIPEETAARARTALCAMDVMPSMRALMTAGPALQAVQMASYNCTYTPIDSIRTLPEIMYILMTGSGNGFSVERHNVNKLPSIPAELRSAEDDEVEVIIVADSREGWCDAYLALLTALWEGRIPTWDMSNVRPAGARLETFGGYASGPGVLDELFHHTVKVFRDAQGRKLRPIEVFSLATFVAQIVVVGGVRRSATICLFDLDDAEMMSAKSQGLFEQNADGKWVAGPNAHFTMANISAVFNKRPERAEFDKFWATMKASGAGEPGIFNRDAMNRNADTIGRPVNNADGTPILWGANPCCEIQLRPDQACNLTAAVIRPEDTLDMIMDKVWLATILGTWQSCVTDFTYLGPEWKENIEAERLLGVSLTGFFDHPVLSQVSEESGEWLANLRSVAWTANAELADAIGIPRSTSVTTVKPAGNSSQLYDVASGIHPRYAPYYVRTIRQSVTDPITNFLRDMGVPNEPSAQNERDVVFSFPMKAPETATVFAGTLGAIEQLRHWMHVKQNWATHTVSATIYVRAEEWDVVADWLYDHFDDVTGLAFLPYDDHVYPQAPYQPIDAATYYKLLSDFPATINWDIMRYYEAFDTTTTSQEMTCTGGQCEIV